MCVRIYLVPKCTNKQESPEFKYLSMAAVTYGLTDKLTEPSAFELRHDKTNKMSVHPAKTKISLSIRPV